VVAGWLMARSALAAQSMLTGGSGDRSFLEAKVVTARFFAAHLLPQVHGLLGPVRAGKGDLMALEPTDF
jgi:3-(methylthio)propanoyl-CoA dehydrogenase